MVFISTCQRREDGKTYRILAWLLEMLLSFFIQIIIRYTLVFLNLLVSQSTKYYRAALHVTKKDAVLRYDNDSCSRRAEHM